MSNWGAQIQINMLEQKTSIYSHLFHPRILITLALLPHVPGVASHGPLTPNLLQVAGHGDRAGRDDHAGLDDHACQDDHGGQDDNSDSDDYVDHDAEADQDKHGHWTKL